ncbi:hypothetical protein BDY19DRAFT_20862 [Irpex rosettiformis]|uniref:Uncharacterized protein n=1 Tax=Irpex rosettiformis TaxID=378272 RepID=A0ACB8UJC6_9APHY|nr:hypothetical protein BDY19DRAFT_20862 [Irpex rosettiformis]
MVEFGCRLTSSYTFACSLPQLHFQIWACPSFVVCCRRLRQLGAWLGHSTLARCARSRPLPQLFLRHGTDQHLMDALVRARSPHFRNNGLLYFCLVTENISANAGQYHLEDEIRRPRGPRFNVISSKFANTSHRRRDRVCCIAFDTNTSSRRTHCQCTSLITSTMSLKRCLPGLDLI